MAAINRSTDMTTGSIWKRMVSFAVPVFLGNLCQQLYNTVDSVIVGKFVGKQALSLPSISGPRTMKRSAPPSIRTLPSPCAAAYC